MNKQTIIFDFGATLDTNGIHWYYVFKQEHLKFNSFLSDEQLRDAYVYAEQTIAKQHLVKKEDNFHQTLIIKVGLQYDRLYEQGAILKEMYHIKEVAENCYLYAKNNIEQVKPMLEELSKEYRLAIVSNFYGNLESVLQDYGIREKFETVIESAIIGVSKPDKKLLLTCFQQMDIKPEQALVVGDSYKKDIAPAKQLGTKTLWLKGKGWKEAPTSTPLADITITDILQLKSMI